MSYVPLPGYVPNDRYRAAGAQGGFGSAALWSQGIYDKAKRYIVDQLKSGASSVTLPGTNITITLADIGEGWVIPTGLTDQISAWSLSESTAQNEEVARLFANGQKRPEPRPDDWVPTPAEQKRQQDQAAADMAYSNYAASVSAAGARSAGSGSGTAMWGTSMGNNYGSSGGGASSDAQLAATLRREELEYQKQKDELDRQLAHAQIVAQLGANPADAVQREIFLRTGMEPVGRLTNIFTGGQGGFSTLSANMQDMTNQGVFGQNPSLPPGQPPLVPYAAGGPNYANGTEITPDGWTTAQTFITGDPQKPWQVNPERVELRVVDGKAQAKVTPIKGPQYHQIASMGYGTEPKYPWGTEGDSVPPDPANPSNPGTGGTTEPAPAFDPTKQYMDKDGRIRFYSEQQLSGLSQTDWDTQQLDAQRKAGAAAALLQNQRFVAGITAEELKTLQDMASKFDKWTFDRLKQRYRPKWDTGSLSEMFDPSLVGYPVLAPATRTRGPLPTGTTPPPSSGTPTYNQPVQVFWGNRSPGWGGTWKAPAKPEASAPPYAPPSPPTTPPPSAGTGWGTEGGSATSNPWGSGSRHYANGTVPMYATSTNPTPEQVAAAQKWLEEQGLFDYNSLTDEQKAAYETATRNPSDYVEGYGGKQSLFQWGFNYEPPKDANGNPILPPAPGQAPEPTTGTGVSTPTESSVTVPGVAADSGTAYDIKFGNTALNIGNNQFAADQDIRNDQIGKEFLPYIYVFDTSLGAWRHLNSGEDIKATTMVNVSIPEGTASGQAPAAPATGTTVAAPTAKPVKVNRNGVVTNEAAATFDAKPVNGALRVNGAGYAQTSDGAGAYFLQDGDWKLADGTYVRYNINTRSYEPVVMTNPTMIRSEAEWLALPETTRNKILAGETTGYQVAVTDVNSQGKPIPIANPMIGVIAKFANEKGIKDWKSLGLSIDQWAEKFPEIAKEMDRLQAQDRWRGIDLSRQFSTDNWYDNMNAGYNLNIAAGTPKTPQSFQISKDDFLKLPKAVQQALYNGTPMPEGYEEYAGLAGYTYATTPGSVQTTGSNPMFPGMPTGTYSFGPQVENFQGFNFTGYQDPNSPPGPAAKGMVWAWIDDKSGKITKVVK